MHKKICFVVLHLVVITSLFSCESKQKYTSDWESLGQVNESPEWYKDAKFGIYFHWGVYSVPAFSSEWYPRLMLQRENPAYKYHLEHYGSPAEFGYHDFVPMFKAEFFDAEEWADLFQKAGARFAGPVAEHHDGFAMWDSDKTPWNSMDKGPKRDITGELAKAFRKRDMKLITTFHHARNLQRYADTVDEELAKTPEREQFRHSHYPFIAGWPPTSDDPELKQLYGYLPEQQWLDQMWLGKLKEVIDNYQPDIIYFDSWLDRIPENYRQQFCAYYLNQAAKWGKEVVITHKQQDLPEDVSILDLEKGRLNKLVDFGWLTDDTISRGSWCYTQDLTIKPTSVVLHSLLDIVSKNGCLVLNISPKADGTIPENQKKVLLEIGDWLDVNGEAIYGTRPWKEYGEGLTVLKPGRHGGVTDAGGYTPQDIRYTTKGSALYVISLGCPLPNEKLSLLLPQKIELDIKSVSVLGSQEKIKWEWSEKGLQLYSPSKKVSDLALVFKIEQ